MNLFTWLLQQAGKVFSFFGGLFWDFYIRLVGFFNYLYSYAVTAYNWSKNYLLPRIQNAKDFVIAWSLAQLGVIWSSLTGLWKKAKEWADNAYLQAYGWVIYWKIQLILKIAQLKAEILYLISVAKLSVLTLAYAAIADVIKLFSPLLAFQDFLKDLQAVFTKAALSKLLDLLKNGFGLIFAFYTNPIGVVIAFLKPIFLEFLTFSLAYALGTVEAELPDWPIFGNGNGNGYGNGGEIPDKVKDGMFAPLLKLYISGYRFKAGHYGLDLGLARKDKVFAMHDGVIEYVAVKWSGYGHQVTIRNDNLWTRYAHLLDINVVKGQTVSGGSVIGLGNSTGNSTGDHLHLEIKYKGKFIDPEPVLF